MSAAPKDDARGDSGADRARRIMARANSGAGLSVAGVPVQVSGAVLPFARVTVRNGHPLAGFSAEYSWKAIDRLASKAGR
jgi:hypothetical protein